MCTLWDPKSFTIFIVPYVNLLTDGLKIESNTKYKFYILFYFNTSAYILPII